MVFITKNFVFILLYIWIISLTKECLSQDFSCYSCTYTQNPSGENYACVTAPQNYTGGPVSVACDDQEMCFMERTYNYFSGEVTKLVRGCGFRTDGCGGDQYDQICTQTCTSNLCNSANLAPISSSVGAASSSTTKDPNKFISCYNCDYDSATDGGNDLCVTSPQDVPSEPDKPNTASCSAGNSCYILRTHDIGGVDRVSLMVRSCGDEFEGDDRCVPNGLGQETCITTCLQDFCNQGSGIVGKATTVNPQAWTLIVLTLGSFLVVL